MYYVYILESKQDQSLYTGLTVNLRKRVAEHAAGMTPYTKGHGNYRLIFFAAFPSKTTAAKFERYLKSGSGRAFAKRHFLT